MRIGLFWLCNPDCWMESNAAIYAKEVHGQHKHPLDVSCFARQGIRAIQTIDRYSNTWPYPAINDLVDVFEMARERNLEFAVISFGRGIACNPNLLHALLISQPLQDCVWSFRIAEICGVGMQNSPRLPFVDDHFIILNVQRAVEREFFSRQLIHASHFSSAGYRHAQLASMIEYSIGKDELNNHFFPKASRNAYGQLARLNPVPFHLCEATGFLTCYPELQPSLVTLLELNLARAQAHSWRLWFTTKCGFWYRRFEPGLKKLVSVIRRAVPDIAKHEFKKRYKPK